MHIGFWNCYYSLEEQCKATHASKLGHLNNCKCHKGVRLVATQQWNERSNLIKFPKPIIILHGGM
jgi:hypothetical protein